MTRLVAFASVLAVVGLGLACSKGEDKAVARLGSEVLTVKMIKDQYVAMSPGARPELKNIDDKERFARDIVNKEILKAEGIKKGLDRLPEVNQARQAAIMRTAWQEFYNELIRSKVEVADQEVRAAFDQYKELHHIAWILVRSKAVGENLLARIKNGEDFGRLASLYSIDPSRTDKGDLTPRSLFGMPETVADAIAKLSPGETSGLIPYDNYYVIVRLVEKTPVPAMTFEEARDGLQSMLRMRRENVIQRELAERIKKDYAFAFNEGTVDLIVSKSRAAHPAEESPSGKIPEFSDEELDRVAAKYTGGEWRVETYAERINSLRDYMRPGFGADREMVESIIGDYITGELWQVELKNKGYDKRAVALRAGDRAAEEAMVTTMYNEIVKGVKVDDEMVKATYEERKADLVAEEAYRIAVVVSQTEADAQKAYEDLKSGRRFEDVARDRSTDLLTAEKGGEIASQFPKGAIESMPDLLEAVTGLKVGGYSAPMPIPPGFGPEGYMIVKLLERVAARQLELDEIREALSQQVLQREQDRAFNEWLGAKVDEYKVEIYPDALGGIDFALLKDSEA